MRGRDAALLRDGEEVARAARPAVGGTIRLTGDAAAEADGRVVLAGGLGPENVREAIAAVRPWAVDAARRSRSRPGIKDHDKVQAIRGGGALMTTTDETYGPYGGRYVPRR